eukprot:3256040-Alexandrium_andersonii.AAC.1
MGPRTGVWRGGSDGGSEDVADCAGGSPAGCGASAVGLPSGAFQSTCDSWLAVICVAGMLDSERRGQSLRPRFPSACLRWAGSLSSSADG